MPSSLFNNNGFNVGLFNGPFNGELLPEGVLAIGGGEIVEFQQSVGLQTSGNILSFKQTVTAFQTAEGQIVEFQQNVIAEAGGKIVSIAQVVTNPDSIPYNPSNPSSPSTPIPPYIVRNGFYPMFTIGSYIWPDTTIHDSFSISHAEGDDKLLTFTLLLRKYAVYGAVDFESFDGAPITLDIFYLAGGVDRIFTGYVNKVDLDIMAGTITCSCVADRRNTIISTYANQTNLIGYYDADVLGPVSDTFDALEKRLSTVPYTVDVTRFGGLQLSSILPSTPNFVFGDSDVYGNNSQKEAPKVEKLLRSRVVNTVNITIDYQYQRRWHGNCHYTWSWDADLCDVLLDGYSFALRDTIEAAARGTGWVMNANPSLPRGKVISFTPPPPAGLYNCSGQQIAFTTVRTSGVTYENEKDANGNTRTGTDGKPIQKAVGGVSEDSRNLLAIGATWSTSARWTQNVKETYNITITAPQSVAKYGVVTQSDQTGVDDSDDHSDWENYQNGVAYGSQSGFRDHTPNKAKLYTAFNITVNRAKTAILKAHRDNRVTFNIPLKPTIDMYHTVYLNCSRIQAVGKVVGIQHICDIANGNAYTTITIAMTRSVGSASDSAISLPSVPVQTPRSPNWSMRLRSIYGEEPTDNFSGFVGNRWKTQDDYTYGFRGSNTFKTNVREQFIVKAPDIGKEYRDLVELNASGSYTMSIPNSTLSVSFL